MLQSWDFKLRKKSKFCMLIWRVFTVSHILVIALLEIIDIIIIQPKAIRVHNNQLSIKWSLSGYIQLVTKDKPEICHLVPNKYDKQIIILIIILVSIYHTVKNIGGEKTLVNYSILPSFLPIFTISITFHMQMDFISPIFSTKVPTVLIRQSFLPPKFFTVLGSTGLSPYIPTPIIIMV